MALDLNQLKATIKTATAKVARAKERCPYCHSTGATAHPIDAHEKSFQAQCMDCGEIAYFQERVEAGEPDAQKRKPSGRELPGKGKQLAVDLDGTLAFHDDAAPFDPEHIGKPIKRMLTLVKQYMFDGYTPVLFTARASAKENIPPIETWLKKHNIPITEITNQKTPLMVVFLDDRARGVYMNTGNTKCAFTQSEYEAAAKATNTDSSPAQKEAGNYKKGVFDWHGIKIVLENPKGSLRKGVSASGTKWQTLLKNSYGYIQRSRSNADGDAIDIFLGNHPDTQLVGVVDQFHGTKFDEHKCVLGVKDAKDAEATYLANYQKGWDGCGGVTLLTKDQFVSWIKNGDSSKPLSGQKFEDFHKEATSMSCEVCGVERDTLLSNGQFDKDGNAVFYKDGESAACPQCHRNLGFSHRAKTASKPNEFRRPENWDDVSDIKVPAGYKLYAGANDWENCGFTAAAIYRTDDEAWDDTPVEFSYFDHEDCPVCKGDWRKGNWKKSGDYAKDKVVVWVKSLSLPVIKTAAEVQAVPTTGIAAIIHAMKQIDMSKLVAQAKEDIKSGKKTKRPGAVRILNVAQGLERNKMTPKDLILTKVPVIPAIFRPYALAGDTFIPGDANELYRDLFHAKRHQKEFVAQFGEEASHGAHASAYDSVKALMGYGEPVNVETKARGVSGFFKKIVGSGPKQSWLISKMIAKPVDSVGRSVISVNPDLNMDQIGIPRDMAWTSYQPHIIRKLVQTGMRPGDAVIAVKNRDKNATRVFDQITTTHPVVYSRAPAWHKYSVLAGSPVMVDGDAVQINPYVTQGLGADFDGDKQNCYVLCILLKHGSRHVAKSSLLNHEENHNQYLTSRFSQETVAAMTKNNTIPVFNTATHELHILDLADFPRGEFLRRNETAKSNIDFYHVPAGTQVIAFDETTNQPVWADVAFVSQHEGPEVEIVNLSNKRQIITDDDPRAVYGISANGDLSLKRFTPTEALANKVTVPFVKSTEQLFTNPGITEVQITDDPECVFRTLPLTWEIGYMMGVFCGDGWWNKSGGGKGMRRLLYIADLKGFNALKVKSIIADVMRVSAFHHSVTEFSKAETADRYGDTVRHNFVFDHSTYLTEFFTKVMGGSGDENTAGSGNKQLPPFFATAPVEFRKGLFCGLMDTDGTVCITNEKTRKTGQLTIAFTSTALRLARDMKFLGTTLGINGHVAFSKTTTAGNTAWLTTFSSVDCKASDVLMGLQSPWKRDEFIRGVVDPLGGTSAVSNSAPFTLSISQKLKTQLVCPKVTKLDRQLKADGLDEKKEQQVTYVALLDAIKRGLVSKYIAAKAIEMVRSNYAKGMRTFDGAITILKDTRETCKIHAKHVQVIRDAIKFVAPFSGNNNDPVYLRGCSVYARTNRWLKLGECGHEAATSMITYLQSHPLPVCITTDPEIVAWKRLVDNKEVSWALVESVEKTGQKEIGYDLCVPGYETFMNTDGVILSNTVNVHVPVSTEAIAEAHERLMPSKMIFKIRDPESVMPALKHEQVLGLHNSAIMPSKKKWTFATENDALNAIKANTVPYQDAIEIVPAEPAVVNNTI